jgi:hypothetical protein
MFTQSFDLNDINLRNICRKIFNNEQKNIIQNYKNNFNEYQI